MRISDAGVDGKHPLLIDPGIFSTLHELCQSALSQSNNHPDVRQRVMKLKLQLEGQSKQNYGFVIADVYMMHDLLNRTREKKRRKLAIADQITSLVRHKKLSARHEEAAQQIREVWSAFGRFLFFQSRKGDNPDNIKVQATRAFNPIMVMSKHEQQLWCGRYKSWFESARYRRIGRINHAQLTLDIVLYDTPAKLLDKVYGMKRGTALQVLKKELEIF